MREIASGQMVHARASVYFSRAYLRMESARISSDDDKYCIERRHAIFIVAAERYGRQEEIYPWHLKVPIQRLQRGQVSRFRKGTRKALYLMHSLSSA